jgi:hypothetical protein
MDAAANPWSTTKKAGVGIGSGGGILTILGFLYHSSVFFGLFLSGCFFPPNDRARNHAQENPLLVLFLLAQKCLWTLNMEKYGKNIYFFE